MTHIYAAYKRPTEEQKPTQTESEGLGEKIYSKEMDRKKRWGAILISDKIDFKAKTIKTHEGEQFFFYR